MDYDGRTIKNYLEKYDIEPFVFEDEYRPTNKKQRFRAEEKTLLRVNHLKSHDIDNEGLSFFYKVFDQLKEEIDLIIFSGFQLRLHPSKSRELYFRIL